MAVTDLDCSCQIYRAPLDFYLFLPVQGGTWGDLKEQREGAMM